MGVYIVMCLSSFILLYLSDFVENTANKKLIIFFALLIPCLTAGLRKETIGTDVQVYVKHLADSVSGSYSYESYKGSHWWEIWQYRYVYEYELGFRLLVYGIIRLTGNLQVVLFFIEVLMIVPLYFGLKEYECMEHKMWLGMLVFYTLLYNVSLNLMRQFMGISFAFLAMSRYIGKKDIKGFWFWTVVACLFHKTSLLILLAFGIYWLLEKLENVEFWQKKRKLSGKQMVLLLAVACFILAGFLFNWLPKILAAAGLNKYINYIEGGYSISIRKVLVASPFLFALILTRESFMKNKDAYFYIIMYMTVFFISNLSSTSQYGARVGYVFQTFYMVFCVLLCSSSDKKWIRLSNTGFLTAYLGVFWYYTFVMTGANQTIPYLFFWQ